jgi:hypothetical protein
LLPAGASLILIVSANNRQGEYFIKITGGFFVDVDDNKIDMRQLKMNIPGRILIICHPGLRRPAPI